MELTIERSKFNDGFFIRLSKNNRYICFSSKIWTNLLKEMGTITEALKSEKSIDLEMTGTFKVETRPFQGKIYVCFKKNNFYINLDEAQWQEFLKRAPTLIPAEDKENVPPEPTIVRYLYTTENQPPKWFLCKASLKNYAENEGLPYRTLKKKVPAPTKERLIHLVRAYLTEEKLLELITKNCYGCQYDMPGQRDHSCLEEEAAKNYRHLVHLTDVSDKVAKVAVKLGLDPDAYLPEEETTSPVVDTVPEDFSMLFKEIL